MDPVHPDPPRPVVQRSRRQLGLRVSSPVFRGTDTSLQYLRRLWTHGTFTPRRGPE